MSIVQEPANSFDDPRWIPVRVSCINLAVTIVGALISFPVLMLLPIALWIRLTLLGVFTAAMAWDIYLILLKAPGSVGAFYCFDLDRSPSSPSDTAPTAERPRLGIRIQRARQSRNGLASVCEGVVLQKAFISPWFTTLRYRLDDDAPWRRWWPRVIPLWPDSIGKEEFRKIRVALKWK